MSKDVVKTMQKASDTLLKSCRDMEADQINMIIRNGNKKPVAMVIATLDPVLCEQFETIIAAYDAKTAAEGRS